MYIIDKKKQYTMYKTFFRANILNKKKKRNDARRNRLHIFFIDFSGSLFLGAWIVDNLMLGSYAETASQFRIDVLRVQRCAEAI